MAAWKIGEQGEEKIEMDTTGIGKSRQTGCVTAGKGSNKKDRKLSDSL
ncbi:MAG: hypothetical protein HFI78_13100 [Lachnospiraceae bacterium]|jgi:hypothetical protein|nr:hypothetical protein [Lachnospiraceae bacterium]